jgi:hypothetical protein
VNLEGLRYDGWPLARLIVKETRRPTLPEFVASDAHLAELRMAREFWTGRNRVHRDSIVTMPRTRFQGALTAHGGHFLLTRVRIGGHTVPMATASGDTVMQTVTTRSGRVATLEFRIRD